MGTNQRYRRVLRRQALTLVVVVVALGFGVNWYIKHSELSELARVLFVNIDGEKSPELLLEIANTGPTRSQGLMWRKELATDRGMIFIQPEEKVQAFWMKNTYISLDMIFVDRNFKVVGILENVPKLSEERRTVEKPSLYVVELISGSAKRMGIGVGSKLEALSALPPSKGD